MSLQLCFSNSEETSVSLFFFYLPLNTTFL
nr:MAG TPA: hypothetical protein [Caudoviricetes sp.]